MFEKVLIANRGEIACRVIRTCRRLGIRTVAVFSEADIDSLHVRLADEAVAIGPPPAAESYLKTERIVAAAKTTGADAVHPGYGFLSENALFAEALEAESIVFIGPPAHAIRSMGDKIESKRLAEQAGVSTVPGHASPVDDVDEAAAIAREIGYPVMIKAAAGGGGKGMRMAFDAAGLREGVERAQSEARSSFGDDRVFLERFIERPRHIEIQVLADRQGNVVHLGERECSIQRRHQKVIEEAPSPFLDAPTRAIMGEQAKALAAAVGYHSAGTVEFIVDQEKNFYFLEMNTRLQVEHPITELITGIDLVEQMLRVAAGEALAITQDDVTLEGWAIEARIYAEDPARGFVPSIGRLVRYGEPEGEGIRVDSGVVEGGDVSMYYDPMIAKLCAHGVNRDQAVERLSRALDAMVVRGPEHNVAFLATILHHRRFRAGDLSTDFIAAEFGDRFEPPAPSEAARAVLAAVAVGLRLIEARRAAAISGQIRNAVVTIPERWMVALAGEVIEVQAETQSGGWSMTIGERTLELALAWHPGERRAKASVDGRNVTVQVDPVSEGFALTHAGIRVRALVRTSQAAELAARIPEKERPDTSRLLVSPMPGLLVRVAVGPGDEVKVGQELVVLEAMKMENVLRAERDAVVEEIKVRPGSIVAADEVLIAFA